MKQKKHRWIKWAVLGVVVLALLLVLFLRPRETAYDEETAKMCIRDSSKIGRAGAAGTGPLPRGGWQGHIGSDCPPSVSYTHLTGAGSAIMIAKSIPKTDE